ncbi:hypothetical protein FGO68_gene7682 [Halteria grandinella]|uniref:Uncharacterized protein n=1 Tax=Halteria grandinella TaxID=5974 RepID=A0A8J8SXE2_HALGN|nr:hypothetical protein FGO68_gene7682 [Halteria grandinella]
MWLFIGESLSSTLAVLACSYFDFISKLGYQKLEISKAQISSLNNSCLSSKLIHNNSTFIGSISVEQASANQRLSSDTIVPFDRTKIRGRVGTASQSSIFPTQSTRPSSSASNDSSTSGITLGGEVEKGQSKLLQMGNGNATGNAGTSGQQIDHQLITMNSSEEDIV